MGTFITEDSDPQSDSDKSCRFTACPGTCTVLMHPLCNQLQLTSFRFHQQKLGTGCFPTPKIVPWLVMRWSTGERVQEHNGAGSKDKVGEKGGAEGDGGLGRLLPRISELGTRAKGPRRNVLLPGCARRWWPPPCGLRT